MSLMVCISGSGVLAKSQAMVIVVDTISAKQRELRRREMH